MARQALGKGLDALIPSTKGSAGRAKGAAEINIGEIKANPRQPRKTFAPEKLDELIRSVKEKGVLAPLLVRETGRGYELIAGERRFIAAQRAGLRTVPVIIKNVNSIEQLEIGLIENIQRQDLNPVEEAEAYRQLMEGMRLTQEQLADKLGKSRAAVTNTCRILRLPGQVQEHIKTGDLSTGHAKVLLGVEDAGRLKILAELAVRRGFSVREVEREIKKGAGKSSGSKAKGTGVVSDIRGIEEKLKHKFGTKSVVRGGLKKGSIVIEYYSGEELERILDILDIRL